MKTTPLSAIEAETRTIQAELKDLGLMHPGSISKQYQVCGRPGCRCMDRKQPQRHGPYHKLAYVYRAKPVCRFVRAGTEQALSQRLAVYKRFRRLIDRWIELSIRRGVIDFFSTPTARPKTLRPRAPGSRTPRS